MLAHAVILLLLCWAIIHAVVRTLHHKPGSILPTNNRGRTGRKAVDVQVKWFHLKLETTAWNRYFDALSAQITLKRYQTQFYALKLFYTVGVAFGVIGMLCAMIVLGWSCVKLLRELTPNEQPHIAKRGFEEGAEPIQPLIPGVTVPFSHLIPILASLFFSQIVHELGHALAGTLEAVPIQSVGAALSLAIPSAFVVLSGSLEKLSPMARARVIAAGPWHNAVLWAILFLAGWLQLSYHAMTWFGYQDISNVGRVVVTVQTGTTLTDYLPRGSMITMVDDLRLAGPEDKWTSYLTAPRNPMEMTGWCVPGPAFIRSPETCCVKDVAVTVLSCFTSGNEQGCVDAVPLLTKPSHNIRCQADFECAGDMLCVRPDTVAHLFRLTVRFPDWKEGDAEEVILWHGPREEVLREVEVGTLQPYYFLPLWLPNLIFVFEEYMRMAMLSLFLFNLLPLPYLDGAQFLDVLLDMAGGVGSRSQPDAYDLERGNYGGYAVPHWDWKTVARRGVRWGTLAAFTMSVLLAVWSAL